MQKPVNIFIVVIAMLMITGCDNKPENRLSGYSHGEFVYLSYSSTAKIEQLFIKKGDNVTPGQELVKIESFDAQSQVKRQLERYRNLYASRAISLAEWEDIRDELTQKGAQVEELINQLKARQLPARQDEISKQLSMVAAAKLERDKALWDVQQTTIVSPVNAKVFDIIYRAGERPTAGRPIISLLPPENIKVRFFIPEAMLGKFKIGTKVKLICDGCAEPIAGVINYISPEAEFTPPVIYSTKRREKLIFMAEAVPARKQAERMKIGQPFDVEVIGNE